mmetsp:Transcript_21261/g.31602  ORF Transcript_21261/g.31602 Transcript_21261/m.31602 type:complete len:317 (-) Transcript_21261:2088-3038(-)
MLAQPALRGVGDEWAPNTRGPPCRSSSTSNQHAIYPYLIRGTVASKAFFVSQLQLVLWILVSPWSSRRHLLLCQIRILPHEESSTLQVPGPASRRIATTDKSNVEQSVEYPDASLASTRSAVVPQFVNKLAFRTPTLGDASHHAHIWLFFCCRADKSYSHKVLARRDRFPSIELVPSVSYTPCQTVTSWIRGVTLQHKWKPTATANKAPCCVGDLERKSILAVTVWIVITRSSEVAECNCSLVRAEGPGLNVRGPDTGLFAAHAALRIPNLCELPDLLDLDLDCLKDGRRNDNLVLLLDIVGHGWKRHHSSLECHH